MKNFNKIILSLGSNIDDRKLNLENAVREISKIAKLIKISSIYESDPILYEDQNKFLNIILEIEGTSNSESADFSNRNLISIVAIGAFAFSAFLIRRRIF